MLAAVDAVKDLPFKFTLTARAENYLHGPPDIHDTIKRLQAYQERRALNSTRRIISKLLTTIRIL